MVDVKKIEHLLKQHFIVVGDIEIDPNTGLVDVYGNVTLNSSVKVNHLPVSFGTVSGYFNCSNNDLKSLQGSPREVIGSFNCSWNNLTNLEGGPRIARSMYFCHWGNPLKNLQGAPDYIGHGFVLNWNKSLPLLRCLLYPSVYLYSAPPVVEQIMTRYQGEGRASSLACGAELARAGFKENARW